MCTLSVISLSDSLGRRVGYRAVMNRDELRTRAQAHPPSPRQVGGTEACWPTDADAGGTWLAASEHGLTLALLNVHMGPHEPHSTGTRTRGEIIPSAIAAETAAAAAGVVRTKDLARYRPFRFVAIDRDLVVDLRWDRHRLSERTRAVSSACFVSSGLGDHRVEPRLMLFDSIFGHRAATAQMQDAFHSHTWARHEDISVMMSRETARTTSVTTVEARFSGVRPESVTMAHSDDDGEAAVVEVGGLVAAAC